jgi:hypothetical protein
LVSVAIKAFFLYNWEGLVSATYAPTQLTLLLMSQDTMNLYMLSRTLTLVMRN